MSSSEQQAKWERLFQLCTSRVRREKQQGYDELWEIVHGMAKWRARNWGVQDAGRFAEETANKACLTISRKIESWSAETFPGHCLNITRSTLRDLLISAGLWTRRRNTKNTANEPASQRRRRVRPADEVSLDEVQQNAEGQGRSLGELLPDVDNPDPVNLVLREEQRRALFDALLSELNEREITILWEKHVCKTSSKELAEPLGISPENVDTIASRARKKLCASEDFRKLTNDIFSRVTCDTSCP